MISLKSMKFTHKWNGCVTNQSWLSQNQVHQLIEKEVWGVDAWPSADGSRERKKDNVFKNCNNDKLVAGFCFVGIIYSHEGKQYNHYQRQTKTVRHSHHASIWITVTVLFLLKLPWSLVILFKKNAFWCTVNNRIY